ncbi:DUF4393 domain-containing protein [uncultured Anaerococcus sp.]|uniref:DUF4393 domain-containing protein n=1 Tax=uncultured Anaerococcus sp. TaxID=293428 RepID=UPI00288B94ED|nr:DUF4393 domain-containing protein [uncultured Anaerococcus sp.]
MSVNIKLDINKLADDTISPVTKRISTTLISIWDLTFGQIDNFNEKYQLKKEKELKDYKTLLESEINKINPDNLVEPKLSIVGPALESSKFYYEEKELRSMFAKLVASAMDSSKISKVRTSFTHIIQQLDKVDALNLLSFQDKTRKPIARAETGYNSYKFINDNRYQYIFFSSHDIEPLSDAMSSSIDNLQRLGLIEVTFDRWYDNESIYDNYHDSSYIFSYTSGIPKQGNGYLPAEHGIIFLTTLGIQFIDVCL